MKMQISTSFSQYSISYTPGNGAKDGKFHKVRVELVAPDGGPLAVLDRQIAAVTQSRFRRPWLPDPGDYKFADNMRLSDEEVALIARWVEQGAVEGAPADYRRSLNLWEAGKWASPI
jgi:hypothetical protein